MFSKIRFFWKKELRTHHADITVPALPSNEVRALLRGFENYGFESFKIKVTGDLEADLERVRTVVKYVPKQAQLTLDGNQGFSAEKAIELVKQLASEKIMIALFEQPHSKEDWNAFEKLLAELTTAVCLDESVRSLNDVKRAQRYGQNFWINLKIMKSGIRESLKMGMWARAHGIGLMAGGMVESDVAMTCSLHMIDALGGADVLDLDTPFFLEKTLSQNSCYANPSALLELPIGVGLGLEFAQGFWK
jgi:L-Ala-D/L-Glu epimerase